MNHSLSAGSIARPFDRTLSRSYPLDLCSFLNYVDKTYCQGDHWIECHNGTKGTWAYIMYQYNTNVIRILSTEEQMIIVLGHGSALKGYNGPGTTWANSMNFVMKHVTSGGSTLDCWPAVQSATTVPRAAPPIEHVHNTYGIRWFESHALCHLNELNQIKYS